MQVIKNYECLCYIDQFKEHFLLATTLGRLKNEKMKLHFESATSQSNSLLFPSFRELSFITLGLTHRPCYLFLLRYLFLNTKSQHKQYLHSKLCRSSVQIIMKTNRTFVNTVQIKSV